MSAKRKVGKNESNAKEEDDWYSDLGSEDQWKEGGSSLEDEASGVSEGTDREEPEKEDKYKIKSMKKNHRKDKRPPKRFDWDDVGTDDDGDTRDPEDITERSGIYSRTHISDDFDMSDIEDQISEAQSKFNDERQSLSSVIGLVDEVTLKGENLTRKASQTNINIDTDKLKNTALLRDRFNALDDEELAYQSYDESMLLKNDLDGKGVVGKIEYMTFEEPSRDFEPESIQNSEKNIQVDDTIGRENCIEREDLDPVKTNGRNLENANSTTETNIDDYLTNRSGKSIKSLKSSDSSTSSQSRSKLEEMEEDHGYGDQMSQKHETDGDAEVFNESPNEYEDPDCAKIGHKHLCCFLAIGGGGDGGKGVEIVNRLKKLKDDIACMREELSLARKECKKESEEVAQLIEEAVARNKAAEEDVNVTTQPSIPLDSFNNYKEIQPRQIGTAAQVPIPTEVLEDRLRMTRQNASSTYRASLDQLERLVEKEMASIQDSMTRLEPLNQMAAEWDAYQPLRSMMYKRDYRMEMVSSEMRLKSVDGKNVPI